MSNQSATIRAADLAERILDEVSEADQDWHVIERCARELYELAAQVTQRAIGPVRSPLDR